MAGFKGCYFAKNLNLKHQSFILQQNAKAGNKNGAVKNLVKERQILCDTKQFCGIGKEFIFKEKVTKM